MSFKLQAEVGADGSGFFRTMNQIDARLKGMSGAFSSLKGTIGTVFGVYSAGQFAGSILEMADSITEMASRLGVGAEWLQRFQYAAKQSGADIDSVAKAIENLNDARAEIFSGSEKGMKLFSSGQKLGLSLKDWNMRSEEIIQLLAKAIQQGDPQALSPAMADLLGKPFKELIVTMRSDMAAVMAQAPIVSDTDRQALAEAKDKWDSIIQTVKVLASGPLAVLIDLIGKGLTGLTFATQLIGNFVGELFANMMEGYSMITSGDIVKGLKKLSMPFADIKEAFEWSLDEAGKAAGKMEARLKPPGVTPPAAAPAPFSGASPDWSKAGITVQNKKVGDSSPDELIRVGNFLGSNRSNIVGMWEEQIKIGNKQAFIQAAMLDQLQKFNTAFAALGMGPNVMGIPST